MRKEGYGLGESEAASRARLGLTRFTFLLYNFYMYQDQLTVSLCMLSVTFVQIGQAV